MTVKTCIFLFAVGAFNRCYSMESIRELFSHSQVVALKSPRFLSDVAEEYPTDFPDYTRPTKSPPNVATAAFDVTDGFDSTDSRSRTSFGDGAFPSHPADDINVEIEFEGSNEKLTLSEMMGSPPEAQQSIEIHHNYGRPVHNVGHHNALTNNKHHVSSHTAQAVTKNEDELASGVHRASSYENTIRPISSSSQSKLDVGFSAEHQHLPQRHSWQQRDTQQHDIQRHAAQERETQPLRAEQQHGEQQHGAPTKDQTGYTENRDGFAPSNYARAVSPHSSYRNHYSKPAQYDNPNHTPSWSNYHSSTSYPHAAATPPLSSPANYVQVQGNYQPYKYNFVKPAAVGGFASPNRLSNILPQPSLLGGGFSIVQASPNLFHVAYPRAFSHAFKRLN